MHCLLAHLVGYAVSGALTITGVALGIFGPRGSKNAVVAPMMAPGYGGAAARVSF